MLQIGMIVKILPDAEYSGKFTGYIGKVKNYFSQNKKVGVELFQQTNDASSKGLFWFSESKVVAAALPCNLFRRWTMFRIIKAGAGIGLTENLNYIKKAENGCYILCPEHDASGIVFEGVAYHLLGRAAMDELETVSLEETDAGTEITKATEAGGIVFVTLAEAGSIDPTTAAEHADLFAEWAFPVAYTVGQIRRYQGTLYKCVQAHTSQADWTPTAASSLWSKTNDPAEEWPEWSQPVGAHDAYSKGAKVSHNSKHWVSTADANVWEPGVYGWEESA